MFVQVVGEAAVGAVDTVAKVSAAGRHWLQTRNRWVRFNHWGEASEILWVGWGRSTDGSSLLPSHSLKPLFLCGEKRVGRRRFLDLCLLIHLSSLPYFHRLCYFPVNCSFHIVYCHPAFCHVTGFPKVSCMTPVSDNWDPVRSDGRVVSEAVDWPRDKPRQSPDSLLDFKILHVFNVKIYKLIGVVLFVTWLLRLHRDD